MKVKRQKIENDFTKGLIVNGQLTQLLRILSENGDPQRGRHFFHRGGNPELLNMSRPNKFLKRKIWYRSEKTMFPYIGSADGLEEKFPNLTERNGIAKLIPFNTSDQDGETDIELSQTYKANKKISHPKKKGQKQSLEFGYDLEKIIGLEQDMVDIVFKLTNTNDFEIKYQFGWQGTFNSLGYSKEGWFNINYIDESKKEITDRPKLRDIPLILPIYRERKRKRKKLYENLVNLSYDNKSTGRRIEIGTNFPHLQMWRPYRNIFTLEFVTSVKSGIKAFGKQVQKLGPQETKEYIINLRLI